MTIWKQNRNVKHNVSDLKVTGDALQLLPLHRASTLLIHSDAPLSQIIVTVTGKSSIKNHWSEFVNAAFKKQKLQSK